MVTPLLRLATLLRGIPARSGPIYVAVPREFSGDLKLEKFTAKNRASNGTATTTSSNGNDFSLSAIQRQRNDKENGLKHSYNGNGKQDISIRLNYRTFLNGLDTRRGKDCGIGVRMLY